ncbi:MAG: ArsR family transcriptional regulator [Promethearchaeota archaeon]
MNSISDLKKDTNFLNLKIEILLFLRKVSGSKKLIYPSLLAERFERSKGAISQSLKALKSQGLIIVQDYNCRKNQKYRKTIKLTKEGLLFTAQLLFKGLNDIEIQAIKALNIKF